jgi:hypothetical protein
MNCLRAGLASPLHSVEALEDVGAVFFGDAHPSILHRDLQVTVSPRSAHSTGVFPEDNGSPSAPFAPILG